VWAGVIRIPTLIWQTNTNFHRRPVVKKGVIFKVMRRNEK
jgi:hypothetical protein